MALNGRKIDEPRMGKNSEESVHDVAMVLSQH
jgi:hypothetical protein